MQWLIDRLPGWAAARLPAAGASTRAPGLAGWTMALGALAGAALVVESASASWRANDRSDSDFAERHAEVVFDLLPQDAVLFGYGDYSGPVGYYRYVEERRPDVALYSLQGLVFANRLVAAGTFSTPGRPPPRARQAGTAGVFSAAEEPHRRDRQGDDREDDAGHEQPPAPPRFAKRLVRRQQPHHVGDAAASNVLPPLLHWPAPLCELAPGSATDDLGTQDPSCGGRPLHRLARTILGPVDLPMRSRNSRMRPSIDRIFPVTRSR